MRHRLPRAKKTPDAAPVNGTTVQRGGRGLRKRPGEMNKTEAERATELEAMRARGEILGWWYEAVTLRLADDTRYTPDFLIQHTDGMLAVEEIKGRWEDDALVKIKVAASMFPFSFEALTKVAKRDGGGWVRRSFKGWSEPELERQATERGML